MKKSLFIFAAFICLLVSPHSGQAQEEKPLPDEVELARNLLDSSFLEIRGSAPIKYRNELNKITYNLVESLDPSIIHSTTGESNNAIVISVGAINLILNLNHASAITVFTKNTTPKMIEWIRAISQLIDKGTYLYKDFASYAEIAEPTNKYYQPILLAKVYAGVNYVVAHECAHILLHHTTANLNNMSESDIRALEYEADALAVDLIAPIAKGDVTMYLMYSAGYDQLFIYSMTRDMNVLGFETMRDHPPEIKRATEISRLFYQNAFKIFKDEQSLKMIEAEYVKSIQQLEMYNQIIEYQSYVYIPDNEVISLE